GATVDALARRRVIRELARESDVVDVATFHHYLRATERLLSRATEAGLVRQGLETRDLAAVVVMALATVHPDDAEGLDRRRYLALLIDGLRPAPDPLPPPHKHCLGGD